ncbi:MAG: DUF434 domain-containing protein [ANME-2 cluster archaeon]|jgi:hypothetical protein|nr:DUF434 domain-containing protein [ANME-2 cluster archaeon]
MPGEEMAMANIPVEDMAVGDIRYLLERGYPRAGAITYVCNHYRLDINTRHVFGRVIYTEDMAHARKNRAIECNELAGKEIWVDGYNVLIGVESALKGELVYLCDDGFIRDTRGVFRNYRCSDVTLRALDSILGQLLHCAPGIVEFLFDSQISKSGELAKWVSDRMGKAGLVGNARTSRHVDYDLKHCGKFVATSDGTIIDAVNDVVNIQAWVLEELDISPVEIGGLLE